MSRTKLTNRLAPTYIQRLPERWAVFILLLIAAIARFLTITKASVWHDEGFSAMLASRTPLEIWAGSARDVHPPLYYELLHYWMQIFGTSELAMRSMSAVAGIATIFIIYILVKRHFGRAAATISLSLLAIAPMLVRYSQEARMYGILGLFLIGGTYALLRATEHVHPDWRWWSIYVLTMAAGLYTHYFTVFAIVAHWLYLMTLERPWKWRLGKSRWLRIDWWLANLGMVVLWLPWLPAFYGQFTRGQGISWIPATTIYTLPKSVWQNFTFTDAMALPSLVFWAIPGITLGLILWISWLHKHEHKEIRALFWYTVLPIGATIAVSTIKPIYQDRYLVFAAYGLYTLLGIALTQLIRQHQATGAAALIGTLIIFGIGVGNVARQATHSMKVVGEYVSQTGDVVVSAELYTYFDFSYYCNSCDDSRNTFKVNYTDMIKSTLLLNTSATSYGRPNGYGESSLLYDRADKIYVDDLSTIKPANGRLWMIGKPGEQKYWKATPANWQQLDQIKTNSSEARLYQVQ